MADHVPLEGIFIGSVTIAIAVKMVNMLVVRRKHAQDLQDTSTVKTKKKCQGTGKNFPLRKFPLSSGLSMKMKFWMKNSCPNTAYMGWSEIITMKQISNNNEINKNIYFHIT